MTENEMASVALWIITGYVFFALWSVLKILDDDTPWTFESRTPPRRRLFTIRDKSERRRRD